MSLDTAPGVHPVQANSRLARVFTQPRCSVENQQTVCVKKEEGVTQARVEERIQMPGNPVPSSKIF